MMSRTLFLLWLWLAITSTAQPNESEQAIQWLTKMTQAVQTLNYEGIFVYWHDHQLETIQIIHGIDEQGERQRLISLNGAEREILRDAKSTLCIMPDAESMIGNWHAGKLFPVLQNPAQLSQYYVLQLALTPERIADYPAQLLSLQPKDGYRYGYRFWLTQTQGFPLKMELRNERGEVLENTLFTHFEQYDAIPIEAWEVTLNNRPHLRHDRIPPASSEQPHFISRWQVSRLPPGFVLHSQRQYRTANTATEPGEHWVYTDGLAFVSLYIEPASASGLNGLSHRGTINAYGLRRASYQITAVGAVPEITVQYIAQSIHL